MADLSPGGRLPLLFFGMLSLLGGVLAGLARLGWDVPAPAALAAGVHGPLMIAAFFGTVISLERAVAIGHGWAYSAPLAAGRRQPRPARRRTAACRASPRHAGRCRADCPPVASPSMANWQASPWCCCLAPSAGWLATWPGWPVATSPRRTVVAALPGHHHRRRAAGTDTFPARAADCPKTVHRHRRPAAARRRARHRPPVRRRPARPGAVAALQYDIARRNIGTQGLTRFIAACLLSGYVWLAVAGLLGLAGASPRPWVAQCGAARHQPRFRFRHGLRPRPDHLSRGYPDQDSLPTRPSTCRWPCFT